MKKYTVVIFTMILLGIFIGIQFKSNQNLLEFSLVDNQILTDINKAKDENRKIIKEKNKLLKELEVLEKTNTTNYKDKAIKDEVDTLKGLLGYKMLEGEGLILTIDILEDTNIGFLMEEKKLLIQIINELYVYGAEAISINNQRIGPYSEVTLAGSHINVNNTPIAQPYEIKAVGDLKMLKNNINNKNIIIENMKNSYKLQVEIEYSDSIKIPQLEREKVLKYAKEY